MYSFYNTPRTTLSAKEAARRANQYDARAILHGNLKGGSHNSSPIARRLGTPAKSVEKFNLQSAVDTGLLVVGCNIGEDLEKTYQLPIAVLYAIPRDWQSYPGTILIRTYKSLKAF